nr:hypothetical protein [Bacteroidota bacterium]
MSFRYFLVSLYTVFIFNVVYAQDLDSLVYFDDLNFRDDLEQQVFASYVKGEEINYTGLLISGSNACSAVGLNTIKNQIDSQVKKYGNPKFLKSKEKKKIKEIYKDIHDNFLKKYETITYFNDLFIDVTQKLFIAEYNINMYDRYYERIVSHIADSILKDDISFAYNYERGRILFNDTKYDQSLPYLEKAYRIKPKHVDAGNLFIGGIMNSIIGNSDHESALSKLNYHIEKYPDLMDNKNFSELRCTILLAISVDNFSLNDHTKAFECLQRFEDISPPHPIEANSYMMNEAIQEAYSRAASYYFRKGDYRRAKKYLNKGLEYVPNSFELKHKLQSIQ